MTIRFYPSRLPGEPLETHEHGVTSIRSWLVANVENYIDRDVPPLTVEVEGQSISPGEWASCIVRPDSDVRMYPVPFGLEAATIAWIGIGISVAAAAYSLVLMSTIDTGGYTSSTGRSLDLNPARANTAKLGDAIREVFGRVRIYPDYVVQPVIGHQRAAPGGDRNVIVIEFRRGLRCQRFIPHTARIRRGLIAKQPVRCCAALQYRGHRFDATAFSILADHITI